MKKNNSKLSTLYHQKNMEVLNRDIENKNQ